MENTRIKRERSELSLHTIRETDTIADLIEKLNQNFNVIREFQGGRQGLPGLPGLPGCSSTPDFLNEDIEQGEQLITTDQVGNLCLPIDAENNTLIESLELIYNKFAHKPVLLSNLAKFEDQFVIRHFNEPDLTAPNVSDYSFDTRLTLLNSDDDGYGKQLHLTNSKAIIDNQQFGCKSGFSISDDKPNRNDSVEILNIRGQKNENITEHTHILRSVNDYHHFTKDEIAQELIIDTGSSNENNYDLTLLLTQQTKNNTLRIPNRTGWVGVWEDTLNSDEFWDVIQAGDIIIRRMKYKTSNNDSYIIKKIGDVMPIQISPRSTVRFKRMNNWVLIEYHIEIQRVDSVHNLMINNIMFDINTPTVGCRTIIWDAGSIYNNPSNDSETDDEIPTPCFFKIYNTIVQNKKSFGINVKKTPLIYMTNDNTKMSYYLDGQVWATVEDSELYCEPLIIASGDDCGDITIGDPTIPPTDPGGDVITPTYNNVPTVLAIDHHFLTVDEKTKGEIELSQFYKPKLWTYLDSYLPPYKEITDYYRGWEVLPGFDMQIYFDDNTQVDPRFYTDPRGKHLMWVSGVWSIGNTGIDYIIRDNKIILKGYHIGDEIARVNDMSVPFNISIAIQAPAKGWYRVDSNTGERILVP